MCHPDTLWIDTFKDALNSAVFAAGVHGLQDDQHFVLVLSKEHLLKLFQFNVKLLRFT